MCLPGFPNNPLPRSIGDIVSKVKTPLGLAALGLIIIFLFLSPLVFLAQPLTEPFLLRFLFMVVVVVLTCTFLVVLLIVVFPNEINEKVLTFIFLLLLAAIVPMCWTANGGVLPGKTLTSPGNEPSASFICQNNEGTPYSSGWIWIGAVQKSYGLPSFGDPLSPAKGGSLPVTITPVKLPQKGDRVTVTESVKLRAIKPPLTGNSRYEEYSLEKSPELCVVLPSKVVEILQTDSYEGERISSNEERHFRIWAKVKA